ncbi:PD-(D/E)XK nuclease-like domain-containing protein [Gordonia sp. DT219]|uniref:PD-(D/E)XK nuclease-like domain-containing protein n=1 Tax=Gordonia sp. DT219 TaxID=3416658 RepID=UPI003CF95821
MTTTKFADLKAKATAEGVKAWADGDSVCPYASADLVTAWRDGWNGAQEHALKGQHFTVPAEDGVYRDVPDSIYHSDRDSLSSTGAKTILEPGGPAKHRFGRRKESAAFDVGHAVHTAVLGEGGVFVDSGFDAWTTKAAKEKVAEIRAAGKTPLKPEQYRDVMNMAEAVRAHPLAEVLFADGVAEQSIWAHDPESGARVRCRPDWHIASTFVDLKTAADPGQFDRAIEDYSYHLSAAFYLHTAQLAGMSIDSFFLVAVGKEPPHLVDVCEISPADLAVGRDLTRAAIDLWAYCHATDTWPGLPATLRVAQLPERARFRADAAITRARTTIEGATA